MSTKNLMLRSFCIFFFLPLAVMAAETSNNDTYFKIESIDDGLLLSMPAVMHKDFTVADDTYQKVFKDMEQPRKFHESSIETLRPAAKAMSRSEELLTIFSLTKNEDIRKNYWSSRESDLEKVIEAHKNNPLCFLQECTGAKDTYCPLTRKSQPSECPRESFKSRVGQEMQNHVGLINPVFYASGDCFFEVAILSYLKSHSFGVVSFIDPHYKNLFSVYLSLAKKTPSVHRMWE